MANNKTPVKTDKKEEIKKENQSAEPKTDAKKDTAEEETDTEELFKRRVSIDMTKENSWFSASPGGLISLKIINAEGEEEFFERLTRLMDLSARSLKIKRNVITKLLNEGLYPYTKRYLGTFNNHFSTIGLVGMNEACLNAKWIKEDLTNEKAQKFTKDVLNFMREKLSDYQEEYGDLYNLEATPAEGTSARLAKLDKKSFPDIITAGKNAVCYTNSTQVPVEYTDDIFKVISLQDELQSLYTGGTVLHLYLGEKIEDKEVCKNLIKKIFSTSKMPYISITPTFSICNEHGYIAGEHFECPECKSKTEVWSRVVGYLRPVQDYSDSKYDEYMTRKKFVIKE